MRTKEFFGNATSVKKIKENASKFATKYKDSKLNLTKLNEKVLNIVRNDAPLLGTFNTLDVIKSGNIEFLRLSVKEGGGISFSNLISMGIVKTEDQKLTFKPAGVNSSLFGYGVLDGINVLNPILTQMAVDNEFSLNELAHSLIGVKYEAKIVPILTYYPPIERALEDETLKEKLTSDYLNSLSDVNKISRCTVRNVYVLTKLNGIAVEDFVS